MRTITGRKNTSIVNPILNKLVTGVNDIIFDEQLSIEMCVGKMSANMIISVIARLTITEKVIETMASLLPKFFIISIFVAFLYLKQKNNIILKNVKPINSKSFFSENT